QELPAHVWHSVIPTGWDPQVLPERESLHLGRKTHWLPAIAHTHDVQVNALLRQERVDSAAQLIRPLPLGEDDDAETVGAPRRCGSCEFGARQFQRPSSLI